MVRLVRSEKMALSGLVFARKIARMIFIGPESDHCLPLSLADLLTYSCLVNLIDVTLACEDANSKLVDVVTVADEDHVGNNFCRFRSPGTR